MGTGGVPPFFYASASGNIFEDKNSAKFNEKVKQGLETVNAAIKTIRETFENPQNAVVNLTIGGGEDVSEEVKKSRAESIQKQIQDSGFNGTFNIQYSKTKEYEFLIDSVDGEE